MSTVSSWPSTRAVSRYSSSDTEPKFKRPEYFHKTPGKGWFCSACAPARETPANSYSATAAMKHEKTKSHKDTVTHLTSWEPLQSDNWGLSLLEPYEQLRFSDLSRGDPPRKRVGRWIRDIARAEGIEVEEEPEEDPEEQRWDDWGASAAENEWQRPTEEWGCPKDPLPADDGHVDRRAAADFKFVEKVARARGLTKDRRRLHAFYRLPTDEKINRIQEIVHFISAH